MRLGWEDSWVDRERTGSWVGGRGGEEAGVGGGGVGKECWEVGQ